MSDAINRDKELAPCNFNFSYDDVLSDYHEIEQMRDILSILFNLRLEYFELGDGDVEQEKGLGVKLLRHTGDFYVGLFQPVNCGHQ